MTDEYLVKYNFDEVKRSTNNIILFGSVGAGKTSLINKKCDVDCSQNKEDFPVLGMFNMLEILMEI